MRATEQYPFYDTVSQAVLFPIVQFSMMNKEVVATFEFEDKRLKCDH